ncbi:Basic-leucine zipper transcription factor family protein [Quillaja saponaria]|uniref:Basic-leucine zipper transcription factor family protein n=1 Tax=Quillaja saponaria TaxID=32244 RepID=A0AAD7QHV9_QUISA|nr:Basic-leucine zipper transcription factor family protein [Quillaja saponaria]
MAQLPPKIPPTMTHNWPSFPHQKFPTMSNFNTTTTTATTTNQQQQASSSSSWVDEFLDFSSARRGAHRRWASDSIAFLETPTFLEECRNSVTNMMHETNGFDRLDDEQLMSMFSDDIKITLPPNLSSSNPSTPSDQNSNNEEKPIVLDYQIQQQQPKTEPGEVESSCKSEPQPPPSSSNRSGDFVIDPKRVKRILANRQSAQRSRVRKLQYISDLERSVTSLQTEVSALSPRVAFLDHQRLVLNVDNSALKQRIAALAQDKIFKDAHQQALKQEIERLRQVYHQQNLKKIGNPAAANNNSPHSPTTHQAPPPPSSQEQLLT